MNAASSSVKRSNSRWPLKSYQMPSAPILACTARTLGVTAMSRNPYDMTVLLRVTAGGLTAGENRPPLLALGSIASANDRKVDGSVPWGVSAANAIAIVLESRRIISTRPGRLFPWHGSQGEDRRAEPGAHHLGGPRQAGSAKSRLAGQGDLAGDAGSDRQCCLSRKARTAAIVALGCSSISQ
jgi:hypothetical protein